MGSRTKYYTDLQVNTMFEEEDNLWGKELVRAISSANSFRSDEFFPAVVLDSMQFYNEKVFEVMGVTADVDMSQGVLSEAGILAYIQGHVDPYAVAILDYSYSTSSLKKSHQAWQSYGNPDGTCSVVGSSKGVCSTSVVFNSRLIWGSGMDEPKPCLPVMVTTSGGYEPYVYDDAYNERPMMRVHEVDETCAPTGVEFGISVPENDKALLSVAYKTAGGAKCTEIPDEEVPREIVNWKALVIPMVKDKQVVPDSKEYDFIYSRFGLNGKSKDPDDPSGEGMTLKESIADNMADLKHVFISYSTHFDDELLGDLAQDIYNEGNEVEISGEYKIEYFRTAAYGGSSSALSISIEKETEKVNRKDDDGNPIPYLIIPIEPLKDLTIKEKIEAYRRMFNMFMYSEKKVKVKWYQTMFFRFIMLVISVIFIGPIALVGYLASEVLSKIDPRLAAIIGVVIAVVTFNPGNLTQALNIVNSLVSAFGTFKSVAFMNDVEEIKKAIGDVTEETEEMAEAIKDMWHQGVWMPLDTLDMMSNVDFFDLVEMQYNGSDMMEIQMETMLSPNFRPRN